MEKKTFEEIREEVAIEKGYKNYDSTITHATRRAMSIMPESIEIYAKHCAEIAFNEGCEAQRENDIKIYISDIYGDELTRANIDHQKSNFVIVSNTYSNTQNKQQ